MKTVKFYILSMNRKTRAASLMALLILCFSPLARAQFLYKNLTKTYVQSFDTIMPSNGSTLSFVSNSTLSGWYVADKLGANNLNIVSGTGSSGAVNLYNFGASGSTDRALGSVGTTANEYAWGFRMKNSTGQLVRSVSVSFVGEQWRKSDDPEEHLMSFSYKVSGSPITTFNTSESGFSKSPFLNFVSPRFEGGAAAAIDGNTAGNRYIVTLRFNVDIPNGSEIMFKWFDRNDPDADHGLAIDDVAIKFFTAAVTYDQYTGQMPLTHFMKGFIFDIPNEGSGVAFNEPTATQLSTWNTAVTQVMNAQYGSAYSTLKTQGIGYRLTSFVQAAQGSLPARTYFVMTKDGNGANHWGTYVFAPSAGKPCLNFQAPHPLHDGNTGEQASYLYRNLDAYHLAVAGAHRCLEPNAIACVGSSGPCRADGQNVVSDHAHNNESVMQQTTQAIATARTTSRFLQMHGFQTGSLGDTLLVISNGTKLSPTNDRATQLGNALKTAQPTWIYSTPHLLGATKFTGTTNVQGRLLNAYPGSTLCTSGSNPGTVTGRFLHIEQAQVVRQTSNFSVMRDALAANGICNCGAPLGQSSSAREDLERDMSGLLQVRSGDGGEMTAYLQTPQADISLALTNVMGQTLWTEQVSVSGEALIALPAEKLAPGMYVLTAFIGEAKQSVKFVIE